MMYFILCASGIGGTTSEDEYIFNSVVDRQLGIGKFSRESGIYESGIDSDHDTSHSSTRLSHGSYIIRGLYNYIYIHTCI